VAAKSRFLDLREPLDQTIERHVHFRSRSDGLERLLLQRRRSTVPH
jgi:hypothetical protein